jgi:hypothetical protein
LKVNLQNYLILNYLNKYFDIYYHAFAIILSGDLEYLGLSEGRNIFTLIINHYYLIFVELIKYLITLNYGVLGNILEKNRKIIHFYGENHLHQRMIKTFQLFVKV